MTKELLEKNLQYAKEGFFGFKDYEVELMNQALTINKKVMLKDWIKIEATNKDFNLDIKTLDEVLFVLGETEKAYKILVVKKWVNSNADATYRYSSMWTPKSQTVEC